MFKKKVTVSLIIATVLMLVLVGCGKKESKDKVTLEFFSQKMEIKDFLEESIAEFTKENPDVEIKLTSLNDATTVLKTRMASDDVPEIISVRAAYDDYKEWAKDGRFIELTDSKAKENMLEGAAEAFSVNDKIYTLPLTTNVSGFFYNKDAFKELGLEVPKTWAEFEQLVKDIKGKDRVPFSLSLTTADAWTLDGMAQITWASVAGGYDQAQDVLIKTPKNGIKTTDPVFKQVTKELDLFNGDNAQKNANGASYSDTIANFASGDALIFPNGSWALAAIREQEPEFEVGMFAHPGVNEGEEITMGAPDIALSLSAEASPEKQEAAKKFLEFFTNKENMQRYYDYEGSPVFVKDIETGTKHPELADVAKMVNTDQFLVWLQADWPSGEGFMNGTIDYLNNHDKEQLAKDLNVFFDPNK